MIVIAVASALGVLLLRQVKPELAVIIGLVGTILIFLMLVSGLTQIISSINGIVAQTGLATELFASILKIVGIGYLCEIAASICQEAGAKAVADMVILGGKIIIMVLAIPIIQALVDGFKKLAVKIFELGEQILDWLIEGIVNIGVKLALAAKKIWEEFKTQIKRYFGNMGSFFSSGLIDKNADDFNLGSSTEESSKASAAVSKPSGAVTINIENFNNSSSSSVQSFAQELEFYRKNYALAKGGK